jgi:hypothetical protein
MTEPADKTRSDVPLDLAKERESFVRSFLRKGVEYTELLLRENEEQRREMAAIRAENARLRAQVASDDAIRDLLRKIEGLETERNALLARSAALEESRKGFDERQSEIEQEVNDLANLFIATVQLHTSLSPRRVVRHLRDMCGQLVGALGFAIYLLDDAREQAVPVASEGLDESLVVPVPIGVGPVGDACLTGLARVRELEETLVGSLEDPLAVIPMMVDNQPVGAIAIATLLGQKSGWASVDHQLFQILGNQAGTALMAANLYSPSLGPAGNLRGVREKL